jgi:hypothetical protein
MPQNKKNPISKGTIVAIGIAVILGVVLISWNPKSSGPSSPSTVASTPKAVSTPDPDEQDKKSRERTRLIESMAHCVHSESLIERG